MSNCLSVISFLFLYVISLSDLLMVTTASSAHLQPVLPQFTGSGPILCAKSHVARRERSPEKQGRKEEGGVGA